MSAAIIAAARDLARSAGRLRFKEPVSYVYNPLVYARQPHEKYLARYAASRKPLVLLGMNPGPWGMAQTGVPFGEVAFVRDWLGIHGEVGRPAHGHPRLAVQGFACARSEVSGGRLWGLMRAHYGSPEAFSREAFVSNYCPLLFLDAAGRNITPDKIHRDDRTPLYALCDNFLAVVVGTLRPEWLVGVGAFAARRAAVVAASLTTQSVKVTTILHPSPASPRANRDWAAQAERALTAQGIWQKGAK